MLFPALWVRPGFVLSKIYAAITNAVETGYGNQLNPIISIFYYLIILAFKLSPITLGIFMFSLINFKKYKNENILALLGTLVIYLLFLTFSSKKIDRYVLAMIPYIITISAYYLSKVSKNSLKLSLSAAGVFLVYVVVAYHPVYSAYYSPLFGGAKKALHLGVYENSGEYFAQAATYLNDKGRDNLVYIPNNIESFNYFYKGDTQIDPIDPSDYIVSSLDKDRKDIDSLQKCGQLEKTLGPKNFPALYIFKCK